MNIEMTTIPTNDNNGAPQQSNSEPVTGQNGDSVAYGIPDATEEDAFLCEQTSGYNGEKKPISNHAAENQRNMGKTFPPSGCSPVCRIKSELNEIVFWKFRLWMLIIFLLLVIFAVIIISLLVCSVIHEDVDEKYDPTSFTVPLYFNGSFQLPNLLFTNELFISSSNESQELTVVFQKQLADLYGSSPALGRYFREAEIYAFRNGSVIVDYQLLFLMPEELQDQLRNFTLSREMVYNVFRQFLYDQEADESQPMYIDPVSLNMFL